MFSAAQTTPITRTLGFSSAMARMAPIIAAPPAMSYFIFSMLSAGLMEMPPVSKVMPLPTKPEHRAVRHPCRLIAQNDQRRRLLRSLRDAPECAHLQLVQLFGGVDLPLESDFSSHLRRALPQDGRRELVARLVDQGARKVLALANNHALGKCGFRALPCRRQPAQPA